ncbi:MAG: NADH-quinone oxidoreductase subunit F [Rhodospirillaceae bacterium]|nr:NADH-quinone oxidoreductase subunit F [Rhodospirillaceae bacterium]MBT6827997.1 NADH-quinone oxidoreductase subunit F [Rhodospirillaceae bacterium]
MAADKAIRKFGHPGKGRRGGRYEGKGRQVEPAALSEIQTMLGDRPRRRDLLIEHLHLIQDSAGHLSARHLAALAGEMKLSLAEVYEVATFYAHFDVVADGDSAPPPLTIRVCDSLSCEMQGAEALYDNLTERLDSGEVRIVRAPCMGRCECAPVAEVGHRHIVNATPEAVSNAVEGGQTEPSIPPYVEFDEYEKNGGYHILRACLSGERDIEDIISAMEASGLRGLGGAGFPTGRKWRFVRAEPGPRLLAVNGDEGEPGTFKDRYYMERDPHRFLEGMLIAARAVEAEECFIYLRDEYPGLHHVLAKEIAKLGAAGLSEGTKITLRRGAGAYICGEESAMLESLEGKRGEPRHKPPFPSQVGLFGRPTLINNVETLYWVRDIIERGGEWFSSEGRNGGKGLRSYSVSGRVREPGVKLAPAGITVKELIEEYCGGMADGHEFKAYLPGGASGGILPAAKGDIPLDFGTLEDEGCFIGSAAVIVLSDHDNMRDAALNLMRFFEYESCGQCTPCRAGTEKAVKLMSAADWDQPLLKELSQTMLDASICGLGQAAPNPLLTVLKHFPGDLT